ncbi:hypothetical protein AVEN_161523-1, partial [Araneus ventricosus]
MKAIGGRGGLLVRSQPQARRAPCSKPDPIEDPPCMGPRTPYHTQWPNVPSP